VGSRLVRLAWTLLSVVASLSALSASAQAPPYLTQWGALGSGPGEFREPRGLAVDALGNVFVADFGNNRIQRFNSAGELLGIWGSAGSEDGHFFGPCAVALDGTGFVYVVENGANSTMDQHRVQKFSSSGSFVRKWGALGHGPSEFNSPYGVAVDQTGEVYVSDTGNDRIQVFSPEGELLRQWGTHGPAEGQFRDPFGIAIDRSNSVFTTENLTARVQKFSRDGSFIASWGTVTFFGVAVDQQGDVYLSATTDRIHQYTGTGEFLASWGRNGSGPGEFIRPWGIGVDFQGNVYVADSGNHRIQKFGPVPTPTKSTSWGRIKALYH
jgi:DNA-binding beta-propeller fold protein YncE